MSMNSTNAQNGKYAEVNGLHMYYEEYGKGSPLVLIHGGASTVQTSFGRLIPELSKTHRIIGVEMQAHGHSDNRDGRPISFEQDAADVVELLRQLHIEKADFFGFSNGGQQLWRLRFITRPWSEDSYLLLPCISVLIALLHSGRDLEMRDSKICLRFTKKYFFQLIRIRHHLRLMFDQCVQRMEKFTDIPDSSVQAIQTKTLIILGDHDVPLVEGALAMYRLMPHASLAVFPGGHGGYMGEIAEWKEEDGPPVALPLIRQFLSLENQ